MKVKVKEDAIRECVSRCLPAFGITVDNIEMPSKASGHVMVTICRDSRPIRTCCLLIPNWLLAEMIHGDRWDGDCSDDAFRFGGGGYDPVWFECGVVD